MRSAYIFFIVLFGSCVHGQTLDHQLRCTLDGKDTFSSRDLKIQISELMKREGLNTSTANLLPFLFQDASPAQLNRFSELSNESLRLAVAWHMATCAAGIEEALKAADPDLDVSASLAYAAKKNFVKCLENECNCELPTEVATYFNTAKFQGKVFLRSVFAHDAFQSSKQHHILTKRSFQFETGEIDPYFGVSFVTYESAHGITVVYRSKPDKVMAQQFRGKTLIWSQQVESMWSTSSPYVDFEYLCFQPPPTSNDEASQNQLIIFLCCMDRFAVNVLDLASGKPIWTFCSLFTDQE